jgi:hypothetical protein
MRIFNNIIQKLAFAGLVPTHGSRTSFSSLSISLIEVKKHMREAQNDTMIFTDYRKQKD